MTILHVLRGASTSGYFKSSLEPPQVFSLLGNRTRLQIVLSSLVYFEYFSDMSDVICVTP